MTQIRESNPELPADLHTHSLRHSFCSLLIAKGVNVVAVAADFKKYFQKRLTNDNF
jgi:site-specific recombinase XerD